VLIIKKKIFLDFDGTITNSVKSFCRVYHNLHKHKNDYIVPQWHLVNEWNFKDQCGLLEGSREVEYIFGHHQFFDILEFIDYNTYEILQKLNEKYQIIITSIGTYDNISLKSQWIKDNLPFIKDSIFLVNTGSTMTKTDVDMRGSIFIDDVESNLSSSSALRKICFGEIKSWNEKWHGERCFSWTDVERELL